MKKEGDTKYKALFVSDRVGEIDVCRYFIYWFSLNTPRISAVFKTRSQCMLKTLLRKQTIQSRQIRHSAITKRFRKYYSWKIEQMESPHAKLFGDFQRWEEDESSWATSLNLCWFQHVLDSQAYVGWGWTQSFRMGENQKCEKLGCNSEKCHQRGKKVLCGELIF